MPPNQWHFIEAFLWNSFCRSRRPLQCDSQTLPVFIRITSEFKQSAWPTHCSSDLKKKLDQSEPNRQPGVMVRFSLPFSIGKVDGLTDESPRRFRGPLSMGLRRNLKNLSVGLGPCHALNYQVWCSLGGPGAAACLVANWPRQARERDSVSQTPSEGTWSAVTSSQWLPASESDFRPTRISDCQVRVPGRRRANLPTSSRQLGPGDLGVFTIMTARSKLRGQKEGSRILLLSICSSRELLGSEG